MELWGWWQFDYRGTGKRCSLAVSNGSLNKAQLGKNSVYSTAHSEADTISETAGDGTDLAPLIVDVAGVVQMVHLGRCLHSFGDCTDRFHLHIVAGGCLCVLDANASLNSSRLFHVLAH